MTMSDAVKELKRITDHEGGIDYGTRTEKQIEQFDTAYDIAIKALELPNKLIEEISSLQTYKCFAGGEKLVRLDAVKEIIRELSNTVDNDEE